MGSTASRKSTRVALAAGAACVAAISLVAPAHATTNRVAEHNIKPAEVANTVQVAKAPAGIPAPSNAAMVKAKPIKLPVVNSSDVGTESAPAGFDAVKQGGVAPQPATLHGSAAVTGQAVSPMASRGKYPPAKAKINPRIGRIFGYIHKNWYETCTATVVPSKKHNIISTAGHCLWNEKTGKRTAKWWYFVPGYYVSHGRAYAPFGLYYARSWFAYSAWSKHQNWRYDFAFMDLYSGHKGYRGAGHNVQTNVGSMGIMWGGGTHHYYISAGYDAESRYSWDTGCCLYAHKGAGKFYSPWAQLYMGHTTRTGGASGGPWMRHYSGKKHVGYVDGVNSRSNRSTHLTGTYFGSALKKLFAKMYPH